MELYIMVFMQIIKVFNLNVLKINVMEIGKILVMKCCGIDVEILSLNRKLFLFLVIMMDF